MIENETNDSVMTAEYVDTAIELTEKELSPDAKIAPENQPLPKPIVERNPDEWVTPNFKLEEFIKSATATRLKLDNTPNAQERANIILTAKWLEKLRALLAEKYGRVIPIRITSGFRSERVNRAVGGSPTSAHRFGLAADIQAVGLSIKQLAYDIYDFITRGLLPKLDQMIREMPRGGGQWVHIGLRAGTNRGQWLVYEWVASKGKNGYVNVDAFKNPQMA